MKIVKSERILNLVITLACIAGLNLMAELQSVWPIKANLLANYNPGIGPLNGVVRTNNFLNDTDVEDKILTFGNSQVGSVFAGNKQMQDDIAWTFIPSTPIACYKYYIDQIIEAKPKAVMLYLSDIDMTVNPFFIPLKYHNFSVTNYLSDLSDIKRQDLFIDKEENQIILFSELIKPLKESVFLKSVLDKTWFSLDQAPKKPAVKKKKKNRKKTQPKPQTLDKEIVNDNPELKAEPKKEGNIAFDKTPSPLEKQIEKLKYKREYKRHQLQVLYNKKALLDFCNDLYNHNIFTIIVDAQYHPDAFNFVDDSVQDPGFIIKEFCDEHEMVYHIPLSDMRKLQAEDFIDEIHFTKPGGAKVRADIVDYLNKMNGFE